MKAGIFVIVCVALVVSCLSIRAEDTPNQAAARAALEQKFYELNHPAAQPPPDTNSVPAVAKPAQSAINPTGTLATNAVALQTAPADATFAQKIPAANTSAQAAALAAMEQKMQELNHAKAPPPPDTNSVAASVATTLVTAPANEAAATTPVTETPTAEAPVATSPVIIPSVVAPVSAAPAVVAPAPQTSTAPAAAASMAVVPIATLGPVAVPARTQPAAVPATPKLPSSSPGRMRPTNELVTTTGVIYKNVEVQRVVADGIVISYTPAHGDWAMTKVYFRDLPAENRRQYEKQ
jgi:ribonuclease E